MDRIRVRTRRPVVAVIGAALAAIGVASCLFDYDAPFRCSNGTMDGDESAVDCGGSCGPCGTGGTGAVGGAGGDAPAACADGEKNGDETDVDCGGSCGSCARGGACEVDADCAPLICLETKRCWFAPVPIWTKIPDGGVGPEARYGAGFAPAKDGSLILFGGHFAVTANDKTWRLAGTQWNVASSSAPPTARYGPVMAYDPAHQVTILHGGDDSSQTYGATYEWTGAGWKSVPAPSGTTAARFHHAFFYHPAADKMFAYGGFYPSGGGLGTATDLYARTSAGTWSGVMSVTPAPPKLVRFAWGFDTVRRKLVIFGGDSGGDGGNVTAEIDPAMQGYAKASLSGSAPPARTDASMVYDQGRDVMVMFGGRDTVSSGYKSNAETWEYRFDKATGKGTWKQITITNGPSKRFYPSMTYDPFGKRVVMFGGTTSTSGANAETWTYTVVATPCTQPADCGTGFCQDGVCCDRLCGTGEVCDSDASPGRCL